MLSSTNTLASLLILSKAFFKLTNAQTVPATASELDLETIDAAYVNEGFAGTDPTIAFGVPLEAQALITIIYDGVVVSEGQALTAAQVAALPTIYVTPASSTASNFSSSDTFTLTLADASSLGSPDPQDNFRHFLANGIHGGSAASSDNSTFVVAPDSGNTVTFYSGPGPAPGQGPHRYAWLLFQQPSTFAAPANLSASGTAPGHWVLSEYVSSSGLGTLVGASFFTVENGVASYSIAPTSSVNPSTLPAFASATSSVPSRGGSAAPSGSGSSTGSAPASTGSSTSGAMSISKGGVVGGAVAAAVGFVMAVVV